MMYAIGLSRKCGLVFLDDGNCLPMQNYIDRFGDETDDVEEAVSAIAPLPNGHWLIIDFSQFENVVRH